MIYYHIQYTCNTVKQNLLKVVKNQARDMKEEIHILNVRLPEDVLSWLDNLVKSGSYNSRSEVIRDIIRDFLQND